MWVLDAENLILKEGRVHSLVLVIALMRRRALLIFVFPLRKYCLISKFIALALGSGGREDLSLGFVVVGELNLWVTLGNEAVSKGGSPACHTAASFGHFASLNRNYGRYHLAIFND